VNPLVQDGRKIIPSVTRVFNKNREMYVYLQAYKPALESTPAASQPLLAFVSLYTNGDKAFQTAPIAVIPNDATRLGITPLSFHVALDSLAPGSYDCQVSVVDPETSKATFWRAPVVIVP
jgi:hypothetical protein